MQCSSGDPGNSCLLERERERERMEEAMREPLVGQSQNSGEELNPALIRRMYAAHFLSRWGARMWEFSVALYMINIWPESLLFTALYGVVESASITIFGPTIGSLINKLTYLQVLRAWLLTRSLSFVIAGGSVTALLFYSSLKNTNFNIFMVLIVVTNLCGALGVLSTLAGTILIEREWVVVISEGQNAELLTKMNSIIRRIDLTCKLLAPVFSGFIISFISLSTSALIFAIFNIISVLVEYFLLASVYNGIPSLKEAEQRRITRGAINEEIAEERLAFIPCFDSWIVYLKQDMVLPGISLAFLYFTVLSFGTLMTATLDWRGVPAYVISIARGISAIVGIGATVMYPFVHSRISTLRTGLWSIWMQWTLLLVCVGSIFVKGNMTSAWMLMGGVAASRLGLWIFDLSVMQLMQDQVSESDRCEVGGVQNSLQSMFDLLTYIMGIIISDPKDFGQLIILSFFLVSTSAVMYTFHVYRVRKHLFHFDKLFSFFHLMKLRENSQVKARGELF
ncbi:hypothetical protein LUZ60_003888 [Juncus effusus]|nr:hypothetical protein LUZ60_003888 [Juncus effusus]